MHSRRDLFAGLTSLALLAGLAAGPAAAQAQQPAAPTAAEVMHWWTSGGESAAISVLRQDFERAGGTWIDSPVAGGGGDAANTVLRARVLAGSPPTAMQMKGPNIREWAEQGQLASLDEVARAENWDTLLPPLVRDIMRVDNHYVAVPVNIHRINWLWINPAVLARVNGQVPTTWDEFNALADRLRAANIVPLAHGGQPWQDATIFETVVLGLGGPEFYQKAMIDLDKNALGSKTMEKAFEQMQKLHGLIDANSPGRDWNLATAMVINGKAGMQIMGDWAKGEFLKAGKKPNVDFYCFQYPGTEGSFTFNADQFAMFKVGKDQEAGQLTLASAIEDKNFQEAFNLAKGSIPARTDVANTKFDDCGKKSMADLKVAMGKGSMLGSFAHGHAVPESVKGAMIDVVTNFFNKGGSPADATKQLVAAVQNAK